MQPAFSNYLVVLTLKMGYGIRVYVNNDRVLQL
jgi:hypothetical protein